MEIVKNGCPLGRTILGPGFDPVKAESDLRSESFDPVDQKQVKNTWQGNRRKMKCWFVPRLLRNP